LFGDDRMQRYIVGFVGNRFALLAAKSQPKDEIKEMWVLGNPAIKTAFAHADAVASAIKADQGADENSRRAFGLPSSPLHGFSNSKVALLPRGVGVDA